MRNRISGYLALAVVGFCAAGAVGFEVLRSGQLSWDGLYNARTALWAGLLVLANLLVLWWYALRTEQQYELAVLQRRESNKPFVVLAGVGDAFPVLRRSGDISQMLERSPSKYSIRNVGPGLAINTHVFLLVSGDGSFGTTRSRGALEPGGERALWADWEHSLDSGHSNLVVVAAEGLATRTARWTVTVNLVVNRAIGEVLHRVVPVAEHDHLVGIAKFWNAAEPQILQAAQTLSEEEDSET